jgi:transcription factor TFIIIB component B''
MFHTGFDLIARLLPNRTRTMVRNKFKAEDRKNPQKITNLLSHKMRLPYGTYSFHGLFSNIELMHTVDLDMLSRETGRDFTGPIPQVEPPKMIEAGNEGEESGKDNESLKQRMSTAPLSGGESDRGEGTSVSTGRGRSANKSKGKRKNKSTSKPPSTTARATSVSTSRLGTIEVDLGAEHNAIPRPPAITVSKTFSRQGVPMIRAAGQTGN